MEAGGPVKVEVAIPSRTTPAQEPRARLNFLAEANETAALNPRDRSVKKFLRYDNYSVVIYLIAAFWRTRAFSISGVTDAVEDQDCVMEV